MAENTTVTNTDANAGQWHASLEPDMQQWVGGMGLDKLPADQALAKVLPMYRGAEQKLGVPADQVLKLPGKDAKPEDWKPIWQRLGAPEKPEDYGLAEPGKETEFLKTASAWFHELGIPKGMASGLAGKWNEYVQASSVRAEGEWNARFDKEVGELKTAWGQDYDKNLDLSNRVLRTAGFTREEQMALEQALGPKAFRERFAKFGAMVGEHRFVGTDGQGQGGFQMSAEGAKARIADLNKDAAWKTAFLNGDADKKAEWTRLHTIAFPEQQAA